MARRYAKTNRKTNRPVFGGPKDGRPVVKNQPPADGGTAGPEKVPWEETHQRTKDLPKREGETDEAYAARQEKYKTRRGNQSRRLLRHTYGKQWGKRVYEGKAASREYRQSNVEKLGNLKGRIEKVSTKLASAEDDAAKTALQKKLDSVTEKKKAVGSKVREFRGQRRAAMQAAYDDPKAAQKQYPKVPEMSFSASKGGTGKMPRVKQAGQGRTWKQDGGGIPVKLGTLPSRRKKLR